jgi:hypothetical protein
MGHPNFYPNTVLQSGESSRKAKKRESLQTLALRATREYSGKVWK